MIWFSLLNYYSHTVCNCTTIVSLGYVNWYWSIHVLYRIAFIIFTSWKSSTSENVTYSFNFEILLSCCGTYVLLLLTRSPTPTRVQSRGGWYGLGGRGGGYVEAIHLASDSCYPAHSTAMPSCTSVFKQPSCITLNSEPYPRTLD